MSKSMVVGAVSKLTPEQVVESWRTFDKQAGEIKRQLESGLLATADIQALIDHRVVHISRYTEDQETFRGFANCLDRLAYFWKLRGRKVEFECFSLPCEILAGFSFPIYEPEDLTAEQACEICEKGCGGERAFAVNRKADPMSFSDSQALERPRLIIVRNSETPDDEWRNFTTPELIRSSKTFENLRQRVFHEAIYFDCHQKHLDMNCWTQCLGYRLDRYTVNVGWNPSYDGWLWIYPVIPGYHSADAGAREAIEVPLKDS